MTCPVWRDGARGRERALCMGNPTEGIMASPGNTNVLI